MFSYYVLLHQICFSLKIFINANYFKHVNTLVADVNQHHLNLLTSEFCISMHQHNHSCLLDSASEWNISKKKKIENIRMVIKTTDIGILFTGLPFFKNGYKVLKRKIITSKKTFFCRILQM